MTAPTRKSKAPLLCLRLIGFNNAEFELELPGPEGYILGRTDSSYAFQPDIDLAPYKAQEAGLSRRHAAIVLFENRAHAIDLGSRNGTFLNGQQLTQTAPKPLNEGDHLRLGNLEFIVSYGHAQSGGV